MPAASTNCWSPSNPNNSSPAVWPIPQERFMKSQAGNEILPLNGTIQATIKGAGFSFYGKSRSLFHITKGQPEIYILHAFRAIENRPQLSYQQFTPKGPSLQTFRSYYIPLETLTLHEKGLFPGQISREGIGLKVNSLFVSSSSRFHHPLRHGRVRMDRTDNILGRSTERQGQ